MVSLRRATPNLLKAMSSTLPDGAKDESESSSRDSQSLSLVAVRSDETFWTPNCEEKNGN
jgi:hypothetical protein